MAKKRNYSEVEINTFYKTCQECGHCQPDTDPKGHETSAAYDNRACKHCGSEALDYGTVKTPLVDDEDDTQSNI